MYKLISKDFFKFESAKKYIDEDRAIYEPYFKLAIEYIKQNKKFIVNTYITNDKIEILCPKAYFAARELTIKLYELSMKTKSLHEHSQLIGLFVDYKYTIKVNFRSLFIFYDFDTKINIDTKISVGISITNMIPIEVKLIEIYGQLYNPSFVSSWMELLELETEMRTMLLRAIKPTKLKLKLYLKGLSTGTRIKVNNNIYITTNDLQSEEKYLQSLFNDINVIDGDDITNNNSKQVTKIKQNMYFTTKYVNSNIPIDFRVGRLIVFLNKKPILSIYNNAQFEAVSYVENKSLKIASRFVNLRFLLIMYYETHDEYYLQLYVKRSAIEDSSENTFSMQYIGQIETLEIAIKRRNLESKHVQFIPSKLESKIE